MAPLELSPQKPLRAIHTSVSSRNYGSPQHRVFPEGGAQYKGNNLCWGDPQAQEVLNGTLPLHIVGFFIESGRSLLWAGGVQAAVELAIRHINARDNILTDYHLHLIALDTAGDAGISMRYLIDIIQSPPKKIMLIGPARSESCIATAETAKWWNLHQISYSCTWDLLTDRSRFPLFYRMPMPEPVFTPVRIALMEILGWKRAAIIHKDDNSFNTASRLLAEQMNANNISVVTFEVMSDEDEMEQSIINVKETDARIIFVFNRGFANLFCKAYKHGLYGGRYVWITTYHENRGRSGAYWWEASHTDCTPEEIRLAGQGAIMVSQSTDTEDDGENVSGLDIQQWTEEYANISASPSYSAYARFGYDSMWAIALVLNNSIGKFPDDKTLSNFTYEDAGMAAVFQEEFTKLNFKGISGLTLFDSGDRIGLVNVWQFSGYDVYHRGSYDPNTGLFTWESDFVWQGGMVPNDEGSVEKRILDLNRTVFYMAVVFVFLGLVLGLAFLAFNIRFRNKRFIKMSSPNLNNAIVAGALLVYLSVICLCPDCEMFTVINQSTICQVRMWFLCLGFTLSFGSMFSKTWRVHKIFTNKKVTSVKIRDAHLFGIVVLMLACDLLILMLWTAIDQPLVRTTEYPAYPDPSGRDILIIPLVNECKSQHDAVWYAILIGYKGIVLVFGVFLAWETRKVQYSHLNDSRYIGFAVYNVTVMCCVGVPTTMFLNPMQRDLQFILSAVCIIFSTTMTLCIVFVPKINDYVDSSRAIEDQSMSMRTCHQRTQDNTFLTTAGFIHSSGTCRQAEEELIRYRRTYNDAKSTATTTTNDKCTSTLGVESQYQQQQL
ncbi:gamma-aminobutyric acid type B receptor subunit 2-like [Glandiceps talaboti]